MDFLRWNRSAEALSNQRTSPRLVIFIDHSLGDGDLCKEKLAGGAGCLHERGEAGLGLKVKIQGIFVRGRSEAQERKHGSHQR